MSRLDGRMASVRRMAARQEAALQQHVAQLDEEIEGLLAQLHAEQPERVAQLLAEVEAEVEAERAAARKPLWTP